MLHKLALISWTIGFSRRLLTFLGFPYHFQQNAMCYGGCSHIQSYVVEYSRMKCLSVTCSVTKGCSVGFICVGGCLGVDGFAYRLWTRVVYGHWYGKPFLHVDWSILHAIGSLLWSLGFVIGLEMMWSFMPCSPQYGPWVLSSFCLVIYGFYLSLLPIQLLFVRGVISTFLFFFFLSFSSNWFPRNNEVVFW